MTWTLLFERLSTTCGGRPADGTTVVGGEAGPGPATAYRWFGSREQLIGEVLFLAAEPLLADARAGATGSGGAVLLDTFDRFNRSLADAPALLRFVEAERDAALRIIT